MKPILLDLFSGAGGCARGYQQAGFYVVGIDHKPQPRYAGDEFYKADALAVLDFLLRGNEWQGYVLADFAAIHASPPCPAYSLATHYHGTQANHPDLVCPARDLLEAAGLPWVIENVEGSPLRRDLVLCGEMFGLRLHRHRVFETGGFFAMQPRHAPHRLRGALHNCHIEVGHARLVAGNYADHEDAGDAMGIDWMNRKELAQAIPPSYCDHIGGFLLSEVESSAGPTYEYETEDSGGLPALEARIRDAGGTWTPPRTPLRVPGEEDGRAA